MPERGQAVCGLGLDTTLSKHPPQYHGAAPPPGWK